MNRGWSPIPAVLSANAAREAAYWPFPLEPWSPGTPPLQLHKAAAHHLPLYKEEEEEKLNKQLWGKTT